ncbi:MAG: hypothetical protein Q4D38_14425 [Planctomycetia bacterium]|nr:hypothetical protein [Planctomycetia bacterium]
MWISTHKTCEINAHYVVVNVLPEENHEYLSIEYSQHPDQLPMFLKGAPATPHDGIVFPVRQPAEPTLDTPAVGASCAVSIRAFSRSAHRVSR